MNGNDEYGYGLWPMMVFSTLLLVVFAASFFRPHTSRDWKVMGGFTAFAVALFTEMYGFPLTIYLLAGPLGNKFPNLGLSHAQGHLWNDLIGWEGDPHLSPFHLAAYVLIIAGFIVIGAGWQRLYAAARAGRLATDGPYARVRHPQYVGFLAIMVGFLLMWPTIPTLIMFPVLVWVYRRLDPRGGRGGRPLRASLGSLRRGHAPTPTPTPTPASPAPGGAGGDEEDGEVIPALFSVGELPARHGPGVSPRFAKPSPRSRPRCCCGGRATAAVLGCTPCGPGPTPGSRPRRARLEVGIARAGGAAAAPRAGLDDARDRFTHDTK